MDIVEVQIYFYIKKQTLFKLAQGKIAWAPLAP
jgi:hypothetical protein